MTSNTVLFICFIGFYLTLVLSLSISFYFLIKTRKELYELKTMVNKQFISFW